jgi:dTDP-4-dehydrorhamnose 3,5-epimerase
MNMQPLIGFTELSIQGAFAINLSTQVDERGSLLRVWDINPELGGFTLRQASIVNNKVFGTLRGLHFQRQPNWESKVIQCINGKVFDVIVDLRKDSQTYRNYIAIEIGPTSIYQGVFIPQGFAHGYITLEPQSTLIYFMDKEYSSEHAEGIRWNDPVIDIEWPCIPTVISQQDLNWPNLVV